MWSSALVGFSRGQLRLRESRRYANSFLSGLLPCSHFVMVAAVTGRRTVRGRVIIGGLWDMRYLGSKPMAMRAATSDLLFPPLVLDFLVGAKSK